MATATKYNEEETRYESFFDNGLLRLPATCPHSPREFAKKGFFYRGKEARDEVVCYTCGVGISEWEPNDEIDSEHRRFRSICPLLKKTAHCTDDEEPKRQDLSSLLAASLALASSESKVFSASSVARDRAAVQDGGESGVRHGFIGETEGEDNSDNDDDSRYSPRSHFRESNETPAVETETHRSSFDSRGISLAARSDTFRGRETIAATAIDTDGSVERPESDVYCFDDWETCTNCTINPRNRAVVPCGHVFCAPCIDRALGMDEKCLSGCGSVIQMVVAVTLPTSNSGVLAKCLHCKTSDREIRFRCGHCCLCRDCAKVAVLCPFCMSPAEKTRQLFFS